MIPHREVYFYKSRKPYGKGATLKTGIIAVLLILSSCTPGKPKGIEPVENFDLTRYLGTWYEIARLNHRFEKDLEEVKAHYSIEPDSSIRVENSGVPIHGGKRKSKIGKAAVVDNPSVGHLKVSFFWPFYGSYIVFYIEEDYSVALVCGDNRDYCWILSRKPTISEEARSKYLRILKEKGFKTEALIFPKPCPEPSN